MIPATEAHRPGAWFSRITQEAWSRRFCKCFCLFYAGLIILLLEIAVVASSDQLPFFLSVTMMASGVLFVLVTGGMALYELRQNSEEYTTLGQEEGEGYHPAGGQSEGSEVEAAMASTRL